VFRQRAFLHQRINFASATFSRRRNTRAKKKLCFGGKWFSYIYSIFFTGLHCTAIALNKKIVVGAFQRLGNHHQKEILPCFFQGNDCPPAFVVPGKTWQLLLKIRI